MLIPLNRKGRPPSVRVVPLRATTRETTLVPGESHLGAALLVGSSGAASPTFCDGFAVGFNGADCLVGPGLEWACADRAPRTADGA